MFLTQVKLNVRSPSLYTILRDIHKTHGLCMSLFPKEQGGRSPLGVLYRLDSEGTSPSILIQSKLRPEVSQTTSDVVSQMSVSNLGCIKESTFPEGSVYHFKIRVNATKKVVPTADHPDEVPRKSRVVPICREDSIQEWFSRQADRCGFQVLGSQVQEEGCVFGKRAGATLKIRSSLITGTLKVVNPSTFFAAWSSGIGRARSYGFGMLSLVEA